VLAVGLTGGIGSGKSTVARLLVERGAVLIDADAIAREVVEPGGPAYQPLVERFGPAILQADGTVDRKVLASKAFSDPAGIEALNALTHPAIGARMLERRMEQEGRDVVVVLDIPLLKPVHRDLLDLDVVVVVDCPVEVALERLVDQRGFDRADVQARVGAQMSREERLDGADVVLDNSGEIGTLLREVEDLWATLTDLESRKRLKS
jgi:dephospho-CoA kinase